MLSKTIRKSHPSVLVREFAGVAVAAPAMFHRRSHVVADAALVTSVDIMGAHVYVRCAHALAAATLSR